MENPFEWMDKYNTILIIVGALMLPPLIMWRLGGFEKEKPAAKPQKKFHPAVQAKMPKEGQNTNG